LTQYPLKQTTVYGLDGKKEKMTLAQLLAKAGEELGETDPERIFIYLDEDFDPYRCCSSYSHLCLETTDRYPDPEYDGKMERYRVRLRQWEAKMVSYKKQLAAWEAAKPAREAAKAAKRLERAEKELERAKAAAEAQRHRDNYPHDL
jgi:hypothetical protein